MIFKCSWWRKWNEEEKKYKYIALFNDFHNFSHKLNKRHVDYFKKNINFPEVLFIIENSYGTQWYYKNSMVSFLDELYEACKHNNEAAESAEYRFKRMEAYGLCIHALTYTHQAQFDELNKQLKAKNLTISVIAEEFKQEYEKIKAALTTFEKNKIISSSLLSTLHTILAEAQSNFNAKASQWDSSELTLLEYMQDNKCLTADFLQWLLHFDLKMLDVKALILSFQTHKKVVALFLGVLHCQFLEELLRQENFELYDSTGPEFNPLKDQLAIPATIQHNPAQITTYFARTDSLVLYPSKKALKPLDTFVFKKLNKPEEKIHIPWWRKIQSFFIS